MKSFGVLALLLFLPAIALGQTFSDANLNGNYSIQTSQPQNYTWSKTFSCPTDPTITFTASGAEATSTVLEGVIRFDGNGHLNVTATLTGQFDRTASANTTSVTFNSSCQVVSVNSGQVVYRAPATRTFTGTYSVHSDGTGTMNEAGSSQGQVFRLAGTEGGLSSTMILANPAVNGKQVGTGIAVRQ